MGKALNPFWKKSPSQPFGEKTSLKGFGSKGINGTLKGMGKFG